MGEREERAEKIRASSATHPVVRFAVQSLVPGDTGFSARPNFATAVEEKLRALGPTDELVSAVLGLVDLAYVLNKQASEGAAKEIFAALAAAQTLVDDALSTLPPDDAALAAIRSVRFAQFMGGASNAIEERKPPTENQVAGGPLARAAAMSKIPPKK